MRKVSVIIPFYNVGKNTFNNCIKSVLNSDYHNFEVIIINDGSDSSYEEILKNINDERVRVVSKENGGPSSARNMGLIKANGEYITFVDADDMVSENYISTLVRLIEDCDADVAVVEVTSIDNDIKEAKEQGIETKTIELNQYDCYELVKWFWINNTNNRSDETGSLWFDGVVIGKLFKRKILEDIFFDVRVSRGEDQLFIYDVMKKAKRIVFTNTCRYYYIKCKNSLMRSITTEATVGEYEILLGLIKERIEESKINKEIYYYKAIVEIDTLVRQAIDTTKIKEYYRLMRKIYEKDCFLQAIYYYDKKNTIFRKSQTFNQMLKWKLWITIYLIRNVKNRVKGMQC